MKRRWLVLSVVVLSLVLALPASTQIPTKSVLINGGFETGLVEWSTPYGGGALDRTTNAPHGGTYAAQVITPGGDTDNYGWVTSQCIDLTPHLSTWPTSPIDGLKYLTLDGYIKSDGVADVALEIEFFANADCSNSLGTKSSSPTTSTSWTLLSVTEEITSAVVGVTASFYGFPEMTTPLLSTTFYADDLRVFSSYDVNAVKMQGIMARGGMWGIVAVGGVALAGVVLVRRRKTV